MTDLRILWQDFGTSLITQRGVLKQGSQGNLSIIFLEIMTWVMQEINLKDQRYQACRVFSEFEKG